MIIFIVICLLVVIGIFYYQKNNKKEKNKEVVEVGLPSDIKIGEAVIRTVVENNKIEEFAISIIKIDKNILFIFYLLHIVWIKHK